MKFRSKVDSIHGLIILGTVFCLFLLIVFIWIDRSENIAVCIWVTFLLIGINAYLISIYLYTQYELDDEFLKYQSGPIKGKIKINSIREIDVNRTLWIGYLKPATAFHGLVVKYNTFDEMYISPLTNEGFVLEILKRNSSIKINRN